MWRAANKTPEAFDEATSETAVDPISETSDAVFIISPAVEVSAFSIFEVLQSPSKRRVLFGQLVQKDADPEQVWHEGEQTFQYYSWVSM